LKDIDKEELWENILKTLKYGIFGIFLLLIGWLIFFFISNTRNLPDVKSLENWKPDQVTQVFDTKGQLLTEFYIQKREYVPISKIPDYVKNAFIAIEDRTFYKNIGVDPAGIFRAFIQNITSGEIVAGGSTISQQLIKNLFLTSEKSFSRKIKEMVLAVRLNRYYSKDKILEMYLNQIYLGHGSYGVETASKVYFGKHIWEVDVCEAALLAGLPKAPSRYDPYINPEGALERRNIVLQSMYEEGYITKAQLQECLNKKIELYGEDGESSYRDHFTELVRKWLKENIGLEAVYKGGYKVYTTIDKDLQKNAYTIVRDRIDKLQKDVGLPELTEDEIAQLMSRYEKQKKIKKLRKGKVYIALAQRVSGNKIYFTINDFWYGYVIYKGKKKKFISQLKKYPAGIPIYVKFLGNDKFKFVPYLESAVVSIDSHTGAVKVLVGGYDVEKSEFNRVVQSKRQPGSAFKPIVYATALLKGYTQIDVLKDEPISFWDEDRNQEWIPSNYEDKYFGEVTLRYALAHSLNAASVYLLSKIGIQPVIDLGYKLGIKGNIPKVYSIVLGTFEVSPLELATVYSTFGNNGIRCEPYFVEKVVNSYGLEIYTHKEDCRQVYPVKENAVLVDMLKNVIQNGTGRKAKILKMPLAGKTGTTDNFTDAWFAGFSKDITTVAWVGYDTKKKIGYHVTGAKAALPIWINLMGTIYADKKAEDFDIPDGVIPVPIDPKTRLIANKHCPGENILFINGTQPELNCDGEIDVVIPPIDDVDFGGELDFYNGDLISSPKKENKNEIREENPVKSINDKEAKLNQQNKKQVKRNKLINEDDLKEDESIIDKFIFDINQ
jgi:penicillin-binding protein 1A